MAPSVPTPRQGSEVSLAWLEFALTTHEGATSPGAAVHVTSYQLNPGSKPGDNFNSEVVKISVEGRVSPPDGAPQVAKHYDLVAKFNQGNEYDQGMIKHAQQDLKELLVYSHVIRDLNAYQQKVTGGKYPLAVPGYVYGVWTDKEWALVMEDVSTKGYKTLDKTLGLDLPHMLLAVDRLARLHAVSHAFNQTHGFLHKYPSYRHDKFLHIMLALFWAVYDGALGLAQQRGSDFNPLVVKMKTNKGTIFAKMHELLSGATGRIQCLLHGDYWTNNVMFRPGEKGPGGASQAPQDLMLIDWGRVSWGDPLYDLQYLVHSSTTLDVRKVHLREILCRYHDTFTTATQDLGAPVADWGIEELLEEWRRTAIYGFLQGLLLNMITQSEVAPVTFQKGSLSSGWLSRAKAAQARLMMPLITTHLIRPFFNFAMKNFLKPIFTELLSGENQLLTTRVFDILTEAFENGVLDP